MSPEVPKLFVSYRWSSPEHSEWVLSLATSLRSDGIDVKLDRWDLRPGQDALAFMEGMVADEAIQKVLIVCDRGYVDRADNRAGGVGVEAQIISPKIYESTSQEKFAAILLEVDEDGRPVLPTFLASRIYFDFTTDEARAQNYEEVVRWVFGKPINVRPPVGKPPSYLEGEQRSPIPLNRRLRRGILDRSGASEAAALQVLDTVGAEAANLILDLNGQPDQPEVAYQAILNTVPLREQVYAALRALLRSGDPKRMELAHSFFEEASKLWDFTPLGRTYTRLDNDALRYFIHDCFVGFVALCIRESLYAELSEFLSTPYYRPDSDGRTGKTATYTDIRPYLESLELRNRSKGLNRISLHADMISETHEHSIVALDQFLEADLVLYVRGLLSPTHQWYPISGMWFSRTSGSVRMFARAESARFYDRIKPLFLNMSADDLRATLAPYISGEQKLVRFDYHTLPVSRLLNLERLATSA